MSAQNYHLKWDAHLSYLNSSLSKLYMNEKFADVMLYTSSNNGIGEQWNGSSFVGISAHKVILSSYSQFFAAMFANAPISALTGGIFYVVLPPELSHRAVQILVQYMYSGEATVSHDILNEVLRGGEFLKIRGLYRTPSSSNHQNNQKKLTDCSIDYTLRGKDNKHTLMTTISSQVQSAHNNDLNSINNCTRTLEQSKPQTLLCDLSDYMPIGSPVTVKSSTIAQRSLVPSSNKHQTGKRSGGNNGISVNKEVAIDPEHSCCYPMNMQKSLHSAMSSVTLRKEVDCTNRSMTAEAHDLCYQQRYERVESATSLQALEEHQVEEYTEPQPEDNSCHGSDLVSLTSCEHKLSKINENECSAFSPDEQFMDSGRSTSPLSLAHTSMIIKKEPTEWSASSIIEASTNTIGQSSLLESSKLIFSACDATVKLEMGVALNSEPVNSEGTTSCNTHTPLICNICNKPFRDSRMWVRHLEVHAKSSLGLGSNQGLAGKKPSGNIPSSNEEDITLNVHVPKKRQRVSKNTMDHVTLLCDLCSTLFESPAEWVRHINSQHTEIELALFNNDKKNHPQKSGWSSLSQQQLITLQKKCSCALLSDEHTKRTCFICHENSSTHSSLTSSKRSHDSHANININASTRACSSRNSAIPSTDVSALSDNKLYTESSEG